MYKRLQINFLNKNRYLKKEQILIMRLMTEVYLMNPKKDSK